MARKLFSHFLTRDHRPVTNPRLLDSLRALAVYLKQPRLRPLQWDEDYLAIPLLVAVDLPPLGNADNLDIRSQEPVLLVLHRTRYPAVTPRVYPDRLGFPKDRLAHLYVAAPGRPPGFCLVRGDFSEWYATKRLPDVVTRTRNWLRDAATGELTQNGQQFEPLRLTDFHGFITYAYDQLVAVVRGELGEAADGYVTLLLENTAIASAGAAPAFWLRRLLTDGNAEATMDEYLRGMQALLSNSFGSKRYHFGYLVWASEPTAYANYQAELPRNWGSLQVFAQDYGIDLTALEHHLATDDKNLLAEVPIICALRRPSPLIGFAAELEFVNFCLTLDDADKNAAQGTLRREAPVSFQVHNEPLTRHKAHLIAGGAGPLPGFTWVAGCGALGSKVVLHLARSGTTDLLLIDPDYLAPHNLVRHALTADYVGLNKAVALTRAIKRLYPQEQLTQVLPWGTDAELLVLPDKKREVVIPTLLDFTASESFMHSLVASPLLGDTFVVRGLLSDQGRLGMLAVEGEHRNPRLDDLQVLLYARAAQELALAAWLGREATRTESPLVNVGVGCNSETTVLADEDISAHAAYFAQVLRSEAVRAGRPAGGQLFLSWLTTNQGFPSVRTERLVVEPLLVLPAVNDPTWQVRLVPPVLETMRRELAQATPHETGGVLLGRADYKTKTLHVTGLLLAPPDSQANQVCFFRGTQNLPQQVASLVKATGNQLGYIGEWHTHPKGPDAMSETDHEAVRRFQAEFSRLTTPLPVFLFIVTPTAHLPFVF